MQEWWTDYYQGLWVQFLRCRWSDRENREQAANILAVLEIAGTARILDVPCGEGRLAVQWAAEGHCVTGVDCSPEFLAAARSLAEARKVRVDWLQHDMRNLPWKGAFDAAICANGSFGYFDESGNLAFLRGLAAAIVPGGKLLMELPTVDTFLPRFHERDWSMAGDILLVEEHRYDCRRGRLETASRLSCGARVQEATGSVRLYTIHELSDLLATVGFAEVRLFGSLKGDFLTQDSRCTVAAAIRGEA